MILWAGELFVYFIGRYYVTIENHSVFFSKKDVFMRQTLIEKKNMNFCEAKTMHLFLILHGWSTLAIGIRF